ncbi:MAG: alpha/beta hydrolase [Saprospiraceae bacterium]|nr:alpha/beta hydrolase [Saprospiraceae bacterium]
MKKRIYLAIITSMFLVLHENRVLSQIDYKGNQLDTTDIVIGKRYIIHSKVLGEDREIFIHVPIEDRLDYDTVYYPVVYVFDGSSQFLSIVDIMNRLSTSMGDEICPKMIVVGIKQYDREKDLGLEHDNQGKLTSNSLTNDKFTEFIEKELQPYVDAKYHTIPYRILIGYSLGGLKAMNIIAYNTNLFSAYIVIDPSLGHYNNQWYNNSINKIENANLSNKSVFLAMAQTMKMGTDTNDIKKDTTTDSRHMRNIMTAADAFRKNQSTYDFTWKYYPHEYHGSVPFIAEFDAFYKIFDWYNLQK